MVLRKPLHLFGLQHLANAITNGERSLLPILRQDKLIQVVGASHGYHGQQKKRYTIQKHHL
jgi:hypothetical protein